MPGYGDQPIDLTSMKGRVAKSFQEMDALLKLPSDPRAKNPKRPEDWQNTTRAYVIRLAMAGYQYATAKDTLAPAKSFPVADAKVFKKFLAFGKYEYEKEVWDRNREELGLSPEEKMAKLGKTPEQLNQEIAEAEQILHTVGAAYQNDLADALPDLEEEKTELEQRLKTAGDAQDKMANTPNPIDSVSVGDIESLGANTLRAPKLHDKERVTRKIQAGLSAVLDRITRVHNGIDTIQKILAGDPMAVRSQMFGSDPGTARFYALAWLIINRNLVMIKMGVIKRRADSDRRSPTGPITAPHTPIPERPAEFPPEMPPMETLQRFRQIMEGVGPGAAIRYANMVTMPLKRSLPLLESAYLQLGGFKDKEEFLNGRFCHLVKSRANDLVVRLIDEDIHTDDREIVVSYNEAALIDGRLKKPSNG
jgi:hypothetical protein